MLERLEEERKNFIAEEKVLHNMTLTQKQKAEFADARKRLRNKVRIWIRWAVGPFLAFSCMAGLVALAFFSRTLFEVLASCVYNLTFCTMVWMPLKSTCTQGLSKSLIARFDRFYFVLLPLLSASVEAAVAAILGGEELAGAQDLTSSSMAELVSRHMVVRRALGVVSAVSLHLGGLVLLPVLLFRSRAVAVRKLIEASDSRRVANVVVAAAMPGRAGFSSASSPVSVRISPPPSPPNPPEAPSPVPMGGPLNVGGALPTADSPVWVYPPPLGLIRDFGAERRSRRGTTQGRIRQDHARRLSFGGVALPSLAPRRASIAAMRRLSITDALQAPLQPLQAIWKLEDEVSVRKPLGEWSLDRAGVARQAQVRRESVRRNSCASRPVRVSIVASSVAEQAAEVTRLGELSARELRELSVGDWDADLHASVLIVQASWRAKLARMTKRKALLKKRTALLRIDAPIGLAAVAFILVDLGYECSGRFYLARLPPLHPLAMVISAWPFLLLAPAALVLLRDAFARQPPVEWSFSHALFFVSALVPMCRHTAVLCIHLFAEARARILLWGLHEATWVSPWVSDASTLSLYGMTLVYFGVFPAILFLAQLTLQLASEQHRFLSLNYPLYYFLFGWNYAFFFILTCATPDGAPKPLVTGLWLLLQLLFQSINVVTNTGIYERPVRQLLEAALPGKWAATIFGNLLTLPTREAQTARLRFLARRLVLYNQANVSAILVTPAAVALFIYRDGYFTIRGSGILLFACHLPLVLQRFAVMLGIHPAFMLLARWVLKRRMRKHLISAMRPLGRERSWLLDHMDDHGGEAGAAEAPDAAPPASLAPILNVSPNVSRSVRQATRPCHPPARPSRVRISPDTGLKPAPIASEYAEDLERAKGGEGTRRHSAAAGHHAPLGNVRRVATRTAVTVASKRVAAAWAAKETARKAAEGARKAAAGVKAALADHNWGRRQNLDAHAGLAVGDLHNVPERELNYLLLKRTLIISSWRYFAYAIFFVLFATFPRHLRAPIVDSRSSERLVAKAGDLPLAHKHTWMRVGAADELYLDGSAHTALITMSMLRAPNASCPASGPVAYWGAEQETATGHAPVLFF